MDGMNSSFILPLYLIVGIIWALRRYHTKTPILKHTGYTDKMNYEEHWDTLVLGMALLWPVVIIVEKSAPKA